MLFGDDAELFLEVRKDVQLYPSPSAVGPSSLPDPRAPPPHPTPRAGGGGREGEDRRVCSRRKPHGVPAYVRTQFLLLPRRTATSVCPKTQPGERAGGPQRPVILHDEWYMFQPWLTWAFAWSAAAALGSWQVRCWRNYISPTSTSTETQINQHAHQACHPPQHNNGFIPVDPGRVPRMAHWIEKLTKIVSYCQQH